MVFVELHKIPSIICTSETQVYLGMLLSLGYILNTHTNLYNFKIISLLNMSAMNPWGTIVIFRVRQVRVISNIKAARSLNSLLMGITNYFSSYIAPEIFLPIDGSTLFSQNIYKLNTEDRTVNYNHLNDCYLEMPMRIFITDYIQGE